MCGHYTLKTPVERLSEKFQFPEVIPIKPWYNIAPSQDVAVVRRLPDTVPQNQFRFLQMVPIISPQWGYQDIVEQMSFKIWNDALKQEEDNR